MKISASKLDTIATPSQPFTIKNNVKQRYVMAPMLFTVYFSMMLIQAIEDLKDKDCVYIHFCTDGTLFDLKCPQTHTKTQEQIIIELLFAIIPLLLVFHRKTSVMQDLNPK